MLFLAVRDGEIKAMKIFIAASLRALIAAGLPMAASWVLESRLNPEQGPDFGGGFFLLLALFFIPFVWAWRDSRHDGQRASIAVWVRAAALLFLADIVRFITTDGFSFSDLGYVLFFAGFLTAPFLIGACLGASLGGLKHQDTAPSTRVADPFASTAPKP